MKQSEYLSMRIAKADPISNVNYMSNPPGFRMEAHTHAFYHINRIMEGSVTIGVEGRLYEVDAGCTVVLPPHRPHSLYSEGGYRQIGIDVECIGDSRGICSEIEALCGGFLWKRIPVAAYTARESLEQMRAMLSHPTKGNSRRALNIAEAHILDLLDVLRSEGDNRFLEQFTAMLSLHEPWRLSLADMCRLLGISRTQLERKSKNAFGCGAAEYCTRLRYSMVCNLLKSDLTLEDIAEKTGFYDACHLSRFFSARAGMPPGRYRRYTG